MTKKPLAGILVALFSVAALAQSPPVAPAGPVPPAPQNPPTPSAISPIVPGIAPLSTNYRGDMPTGALPPTTLPTQGPHNTLLLGPPITVVPPATVNIDTAILGGGDGALSAADYLIQQGKSGSDILMLEQAPRFGGNAKATSYNGILIQDGASYFDKPDPGSYMDVMTKRLGLTITPDIVHYIYDDPVWIKRNGTWTMYPRPYLEGTTKTPTNIAQFNAVDKFFRDMGAGNNGLVYPDTDSEDDTKVIPGLGMTMVAYVNQLNGITFLQYLKTNILKLGPSDSLDPDLQYTLSKYFESANNGTIDLDQLSASDGLNFIVWDYYAGMVSLPAGNATISDNYVKLLTKEMPEANMKTSSLVVQIVAAGAGWDITYKDLNTGNLTTVHADKVINNMPPFMTAKVMKGLDPQLIKDWALTLQVRPYMVGYFVINQAAVNPDPGHPLPFDVSFFDPTVMAIQDPRQRSIAQGPTDPVFSYVTDPSGDPKIVVQAYWPLPYPHARPDILPETTQAANIAKLQSYAGLFCQMVGADPKNIDADSYGLTRYGHAIPLASVGLRASGLIKRWRTPINGTFFNVGQATLPGLESIILRSKNVSTAVRALDKGATAAAVPATHVITPEASKAELDEESKASASDSGTKVTCPYMLAKMTAQNTLTKIGRILGRGPRK